MRKSISELIDEFEASRNVDRDPRVGPSDYGKCPRQVQLRVRGAVPGEPRVKTRAATMGTLFWQGLGEHVAKTHPDAVVESAVKVPGLEREGSYDLRWWDDGELVDVKTVSERAYDRVVTFGAKDENVGQLETYALAINREPLQQAPIETLTLAYVNRDNGDVHEISWAYDEDVARSKLTELVHLEQMIDDGHELPRAENARLGAFPCDWCPFWRECWNVPDGEAPDDYAARETKTDADVEVQIELYLAAGQRESEAKAVKAAARDRLVGIDYAANGYKLSWGGGRVTYDTEIDHDELVALAQLHGLAVPMKTVENRVSRRINVRRSTS